MKLWPTGVWWSACELAALDLYHYAHQQPFDGSPFDRLHPYVFGCRGSCEDTHAQLLARFGTTDQIFARRMSLAHDGAVFA